MFDVEDGALVFTYQQEQVYAIQYELRIRIRRTAKKYMVKIKRRTTFLHHDVQPTMNESVALSLIFTMYFFAVRRIRIRRSYCIA